MDETIGHYEILGLLGTGGFGTVYRARDTRVGRTVAIRVLGEVPADRTRLARFIDAVRPFTDISHPHVATLFEVGEHRDCAYLVYEFVPGERLTSLAAGRPLNLRRALDLCTQVADALAEAHAFGLTHGTLTPTSIAVTPKGHVKVLDFGLAAWQPGSADRQTAARLADRGAAVGPGTVGYMSPEQVLGQPVDHRTDFFSLGVILYELLTGRQPFQAPTPADTGLAVVQHAPPPPSRIQADVPAEIDKLVARTLAKNAGDRYESAAALAADLRASSSVVLHRETSHEVSQAAAPGQAKTSFWRTAILLMLLLATLAVTGWTVRDSIRQAWQSYFGPVLTPVIAVTPFTMVEPGASRAYFGAGVAEEVARQLGHMPGVIVAGRSTIRTLSGKPIDRVAQETHASLVLTGSLAPGPDGWTSFDLTVELADGKNSQLVWRNRYSGPAGDIGAIQARVARDIVTRLKIPYTPSAMHDRAVLRLVNPDAYDAYLQGREAQAAGDTAKAAQLFEAAIEADPSLIEAQAALAEALYMSAAFDARVDYGDVLPRMRQAAEEASTADPDLAPAQLAMGLSAATLPESFVHLRKAIELDRSYTNAYLAVADVLRDIDPARAIRFARRAAELDPLQPLATYQQAASNLALGEYAETMAAIARGQAQAPTAPYWESMRQRVWLVQPGPARGTTTAARSVSDFAPGAVVRAMMLASEGRRADAIEMLAIVMRMNPGFCQAKALLAGITLKDGNRGEALRLAAEIERAAQAATDRAPWARCAAMAAASVGDAPQTAFWIDRAAADERALRLWGATSAVLSPQAGIRQKSYPWSNVLNNSRVGYAIASMESAIVRARADAAKTLEGLELGARD